MNYDLFESLAEHKVPPVPENLSRGLHGRLNRVLVFVHVVEFVVGVVPYCLLHFARATAGLIVQSISGRFPEDRTPRTS